jgi:hypothetical protein
MKITTNHHDYPILSYHGLNAKEKKEHDWGAEEHSFVRYLGYAIPLENFSRVSDMPGWDGAAPDSYFSGVVIKINGDGETCKLGRYCT